ncbi:MAG: thioesterase family protein [Pirellulales bacterium]
MLTRHEITIRVRYQETDAQARVHHANYVTYFEQGRVELLRAAGFSYKRLEEEGILLVVAEIECRYYLPAEYDDLLRLVTTTVRAKGARIEHRYELYRDEELVVEGRSVVACVDRSGRVRRLPPWLCTRENPPDDPGQSAP